MRPFEHKGTVIAVHLHDLEVDVLRELSGQLQVLLSGRASSEVAPVGSAAALLAQLGIGGSAHAPLDPALARLLPDAYTNDEAASSDHRRLTELGLVDRKITNANTVARTLGTTPVELDRPEAQSWLRTLTDLRLTLAARLHIEDDDDAGIGDPGMLEVYDWLGYLQGMLLETIELSEANDEP